MHQPTQHFGVQMWLLSEPADYGKLEILPWKRSLVRSVAVEDIPRNRSLNPDPDGWWTTRFLLDYGLIAGGAAAYFIGEDLTPRSRSIIGPTYTRSDLLELFRSDDLDAPYLEEDLEESIPEYWIHRMLIGTGMLLAGMEGIEWAAGSGSDLRFHQTAVGYTQSIALTATITSLSKPFFARLRPDFRERALRFYCPELSSPEYQPYCGEYRDQPLNEDPEEARELYHDGRKSFISGHSSHSFNLFGFTSLAIGGRYVWGEEATSTSKVVGVAAQATLLATALYISSSRVRDHRHHLSDVLVGAAVGTTIANLTYWSRFDRHGQPRLRIGRQASDRSESADRSTEGAQMQISPWISPNSSGGGFRLDVRF